MLRLAPRIGVSLLVTLLFGPLSSTAHDLDDKTHDSEGKRSELTWAVLVEGQGASNQYCFAPAPGYLAACYHIAWTGEDHQDCVRRAEVATGRCMQIQPQQPRPDHDHDHDRDHDRDHDHDHDHDHDR